MIVQNAVASYHWNNQQATILPFYVHTLDDNKELCYKTYFVISNEMAHDATTFHSFRARFIEEVKKDFPRLEREYVSDGTASQCKNFKNVGNLIYHKEDFGLAANWCYSATSHGTYIKTSNYGVIYVCMKLK